MKRRIDEAVFIDAYDRYADALFRYCYFHVRDRERAKDLMQDSFAKTWTYLRSGKEVENLQAFLYRVAHNACMDELSRTKTASLEELKESAGYDPEDVHQTSPEEQAERALLLRRLASLDDASREILTLRYLSGLPVSEVARMLGIQANAASVRIHRALVKLKSTMQ